MTEVCSHERRLFLLYTEARLWQRAVESSLQHAARFPYLDGQNLQLLQTKKVLDRVLKS